MENKIARNEHKIIELKIRAAKSILENPFPTEQTKRSVRGHLEAYQNQLEKLLATTKNTATE